MRSLRLVVALSLAAGFVVSASGGALASAPTSPGTDQRVMLPDDVVPDHYDIAIKPDRKALTFAGTVRIDLTVVRATDRIVLNDADIIIDQAEVTGEGATPGISYDAKTETATFAFDRPLAPGHYSLSLAYHGKIYLQASGLFALDYQTKTGSKRALFTQFENSDARRFVPCWDEPGRKATFTLTVTAPGDEMAISNMPVAETAPLDGGLVKVRFAETPKMSSYLLFMGIGDFERVHREVQGVDVGVIVKRGDAAQAGYALDAAAQILPYYNDYFGKPYPLPKLDLIGGPGSSQFFSAMENWGAIFYFERALLIDPRLSTQGDRQEVYLVVAHEMAHQWFGDLVTMAWWDDLWLNEGFATWMENKVTDHFHPEWNIWLQDLGAKEAAMQTDARTGSHAVITPINDVLQAGGAFDVITYQKGAAVIRMLEAYVGEEAFRAGVRRYMADHAYGNTVTDDLWREIDPMSPKQRIADIAHQFTLQPGVPLIREEEADCRGDRTLARLGQSRFGVDAVSRRPAFWRTPVIARTLGGGEVRTVAAAPRPATVRVSGCGPLVINAGQSGYFRVQYSADGLQALAGRYGDLPAVDQLGVLNDTRALAYAGDQPMAAFLDLTRRPDGRTDPIIWEHLAGYLAGLDRLYDDQPGQAAFRAYVRQVMAPALALVGWDPRPGEGDNFALMREAVLNVLGQCDDALVTAEAHKRFTAFLGDPASLSPADRQMVLAVAGRRMTAAEWRRLHDLARQTRSDMERQDLYVVLARTDDSGLAAQALDLALSGEPPATTAPMMIRSVGARHPQLALAFTSAHWEAISALLEPDSRAIFAPRLVSGGADLALIDQLTTFATLHIPSDAERDTRSAIASIRYQAMVRQTRLPEANRWLAQHSLAQ